MTKKHFIALADTIKAHATRNGLPMWDGGHLAVLAGFCASQNPNFNRERWLNYIAGECGPNGGQKKGGA